MNEWIFSRTEIFRKSESWIDWSNYATSRLQADLKNAAGVDSSKFAKKVDLANLNSDVDRLDIDKLENIPSNLSNLKNKNKCCQKNMYIMLR